MKPLRILLVSNKCPPDFDGGYELRAFQIAQALRARGHQLELATSHFRPTFTGARNDPEWVHRIFRYVIVSKSKTAWRKVDRLWRRIASTSVARENVPAMERFLAGRQFDLAYCFGLHRISLAVTAPLVRAGVPILWHAGDGFIVDHLRRWPREIPGYRLSMTLFARHWYALEQCLDYRNIACVSQFLLDYFTCQGMAPGNPMVISRGIDFPLGKDVDRPRTAPATFFMASRIDPEKGIEHAITASRMLRERRPELDWRLEIAGLSLTGHRAELEAQIRAGGLGDRVVFLGQLPRAETLERMRCATAFIFASTYGEPFSSTIIESLASGTPLLGSDDGSILEVVEPGVHALIHRKNEPAELSANMERILDDATLRHELANAGVKLIADRYTIDRILDRTEAAFESVIARQTPHPL